MFKTFFRLLCLIGIVFSNSAFAEELGEDGLHKKDWFTSSFRDIKEDMEEAKANGKRLVIIFEQRGCIYCKKLHETVLKDPEVVDYITENFVMIQYNLFGDEEVSDMDGEVLSEKTAANKWRVIYTPTIMFLPENVDETKSAGASAVSIMPGAFGKWTTLNMFKWVNEKGYEGEEHFQKYHARMIEEARAAGKLSN